jgi:reverse gyrase
MNEAIRTERRFGVTATLNPSQVRNLFALRNSETYLDLLDVMEQCCIEVETVLINTDADKEAEVLANHKMSKAAWMIFTHLQEKLNDVVNSYMASVAKPVTIPAMTEEEMERENILNPTIFMPQMDDGYGP